MGGRLMATFTVMMPIAGALHIDVEAKDADEAVEKAWAAYDNAGPDAGEVEWEVFEEITKGNVSYAPLNRIDVVKHGSGL